MHLRVENLGPLREAEVDLSKRLIVLTGPNNTGKTYLAWSVYGLSQARVRSPLKVPFLDDWAQSLVSSPSHELDLETLPSGRLQELLLALAARYREQLHLCFAAERDAFRDVKIELVEGGGIRELVSAFDKPGFMSFLRLSPVPETLASSRCVLVRAVEGTSRLKLAVLDGSTGLRTIGSLGLREGESPPSQTELDSLTKEWLGGATSKELAQAEGAIREILEGGASRAFFQPCTLFPAERIAVNIFAKELALKRSKLVDDLVDEALDGREGLPLERVTERVGRYPWPIRDSLRVANDLAQLAKQGSSFADLAEELEASVLGGRVRASEQGEMLFSPSSSPERQLNMHLTASVVKSLSSLVFYFRHMAKLGDFIIVDEPELNLHPDNQRVIARVLAKAVNRGFRVMISTHSDYIIRELNNLIMLSRLSEEEQEDLGFEPEWALAPEKVGVYLFDGGTAQPVPVEETGFSVKTIDEVTNKLNADTQRLYARLEGEG
jgi:AAA ATPase domain